MQNRIIVVLGTGGTIAGVADRPDDQVGYRAGVLGPAALVAAVPPLARVPLETEAVAQLDSSDMDHATWRLLWLALRRHLARPEVAAVVVTHGTDTLEETAYFLHRTIDAAKPVVLTAAMRPASALSADGPQNLLDAVTVAAAPGVRGVLVAFGGRVFGGAELRKVHGWQLDAFSAGDAGPLALVQDGRLRALRTWPAPTLHPAATRLEAPGLAERGGWPVVEIVTSHAGARGTTVDALVAAEARGLVIAGTGNGGVHAELEAASRRAQQAGVRVLRASRCQLGGVVGSAPDRLPAAGALTAVQARVELLLDLIAAD